MSDQEIANVTDVLMLIAEVIDEPPSTPALLLLIGHKLEQGLEQIGRTGSAGSLIAKDPGGFQTNVTLRALGERLFILGRRHGPGIGINVMTDVHSAVFSRRGGRKSRSFGAVDAAWNGIGEWESDGG